MEGKTNETASEKRDKQDQKSGLICLVIMIKDGKSVIGPTMRAAMPHMDAWFIFDTGSTDGTQDFISRLVAEEFPDMVERGAIVEEPFVNFEVSRSRALEVARQHFPHVKFQMMLDDSYILHNGHVLREFLEKRSSPSGPKGQDGFMITIGSPTSSMLYNSLRIFRTSAKVAYEGVVHEVPKCTGDEIVPRQCFIEDGRSEETAERSQQRFHRDLALLLPAVKSGAGNYTRNVFYLAQTYECLKRHEKAVEWYRKRTELNPPGFLEEIYISFYRLGRIWHKRMGRDWETAQNFYIQGHGVNPRRWECPYKLAKYYYKMANSNAPEVSPTTKRRAWNLCHSFAHMAVGLRTEHASAHSAHSAPNFSPDEDDLFSVANIYTRKMPNVYCMSAWYCDNVKGRNHDKARQLLMNCIKHFPNLQSPQNQIAFFNDRLKDMHVNRQYPYPAQVVSELFIKRASKKTSGLNDARIVVTMTTCKRFDLFSRTINSFLACCTDVDLVDRWIVVDDNSSPEDRQRMEKLYPFFEFIFKTPDERGHAKSMNMLQKTVLKTDVDFIFHMEDDWLFIEKRPYFTLLLDVLATEPECGQALVNRHYGERLHDDPLRIVGPEGGIRQTRHEVRYLVHEHIDADGTDEEKAKYNAAINQVLPTQGAHTYWPHYSLRPGLLRTRVWQELGPYDELHRHFEMEFARRYTKAGFKTAFLDGIFSLHIGKLTSEREEDVASAYTLNETKRF